MVKKKTFATLRCRKLTLPANNYYKLLNKRQKSVKVFLKITKVFWPNS